MTARAVWSLPCGCARMVEENATRPSGERVWDEFCAIADEIHRSAQEDLHRYGRTGEGIEKHHEREEELDRHTQGLYLTCWLTDEERKKGERA